MPDSHRTTIPRSLRVAEEVQRILGEVFLTRVRVLSAGMLTVTHVDITRDLRIAKVYLSFLNPSAPKEEVLGELLRRRKEIRYHMGNELRAKYVPELRFYLDESVEYSSRIQAIIENLHRDGTDAEQ
ncbi:MAG: 30S ribosome-binding factor RbfA [Calditrichaeota bacterium]|nr:30S ribosome-binding factor RbfA [Calditrichota bacterium]